MYKLPRHSLVVDVERKLLGWLVFENRGAGGVLPPIPKIAKWQGVGQGVVREALARLEALGLVTQSRGAQLEFIPSQLAVSVDTIPVLFHAAPNVSERLRLLKAWVSLKWLVAREAIPMACQSASPEGREQLRKELTDLTIVARVGEVPEAIIHQEICVLWTAAKVADHAALKPIANGLVRSVDPLREVWPTVVDPERVRRFSSFVLNDYDNVKTSRLRAFLNDEHRAQLSFLDEVCLPLQKIAPEEPPRERHCIHEEVTEPGTPFQG